MGYSRGTGDTILNLFFSFFKQRKKQMEINKHKGKRELAKDILRMVNKRNSKGASKKENED